MMNSNDKLLPAMTLREWYIGQALLGYCANSSAAAAAEYSAETMAAMAVNIGNNAYLMAQQVERSH